MISFGTMKANQDGESFLVSFSLKFLYLEMKVYGVFSIRVLSMGSSGKPRGLGRAVLFHSLPGPL